MATHSLTRPRYADITLLVLTDDSFYFLFPAARPRDDAVQHWKTHLKQLEERKRTASPRPPRVINLQLRISQPTTSINTLVHHDRRFILAPHVRRARHLAPVRARQPLQHVHRRPGREHLVHRRDGLDQPGQARDARARRDQKPRRRVDMARVTLGPAHHPRPPAGACQCLAQKELHPILGVRAFFFFFSQLFTN